MEGHAKSLFLLRVLFKCLFLLINLRLLGRNFSWLHTSESVESKLGFSFSNAQKQFPRSKCLSSVFSKCLFSRFARYEGNKAIISASQSAVLVTAPFQMKSHRPGTAPN